MALSPIAPAAIQVQPVAETSPPAPVADPAVSVTPAADTQKNSGTGSSTADGSSQQPSGQQLPLDRALQKINGKMEAWATQIQFDIDPDTHRVVVSIKDSKSGQVLQQIPSETVLHIAKMITELQGSAIKTSA